MKQKGTLFLAAAAALVIGSLAWAVDTNMPTSSTPVTGKITYVDTATGRFTVEETNGNSTTFDTTGTTSYVQNGRTVLLGDLKVGDQVTVTSTGEAGSRTAMSVTMNPGSTTTGSAYGSNTGNRYNTGSTTTGSTYERSKTESTTTASNSYDRNNTRSRNDQDRLPKTASPVPLVGLAGLLLLGAGAAMKVRTRGMH